MYSAGLQPSSQRGVPVIIGFDRAEPKRKSSPDAGCKVAAGPLAQQWFKLFLSAVIVSKWLPFLSSVALIDCAVSKMQWDLTVQSNSVPQQCLSEFLCTHCMRTSCVISFLFSFFFTLPKHLAILSRLGFPVAWPEDQNIVCAEERANRRANSLYERVSSSTPRGVWAVDQDN